MGLIAGSCMRSRNIVVYAMCAAHDVIRLVTNPWMLSVVQLGLKRGLPRSPSPNAALLPGELAQFKLLLHSVASGLEAL